jgi:hypothetical protein
MDRVEAREPDFLDIYSAKRCRLFDGVRQCSRGGFVVCIGIDEGDCARVVA